MSGTHKRKAQPPPQVPHKEKLSFTFRAECMADVADVFRSLLADDGVTGALCHFSAEQHATLPDVEAVLVFRTYDSTALESIAAAMTALRLIAALEGDRHDLVNESLNFTDEYDGTRTGTGRQRADLAARITTRFV